MTIMIQVVGVALFFVGESLSLIPDEDRLDLGLQPLQGTDLVTNTATVFGSSQPRELSWNLFWAGHLVFVVAAE